MAIATSAAEAYDRYSAALQADALTQGSWHSEQDGRHLACALGVIGDTINSPSDCPAQIMPGWLAKMVPWFFDNQDQADAYAWGLSFYAELKRIDGKVPFAVVHDWHATVITPLAIEISEQRERNPETHRALQALHQRSLAGEKISRDDWYATLKPALFDANAYAYADADADAYANANTYADAYADADADAYANANTYADAYAYTYTYAYAYADAYAYTYAYAYADTYAVRRARIKRYADGMIECLRRVSV